MKKIDRKEILLCIISFFTGAIFICLTNNLMSNKEIEHTTEKMSFEKAMSSVLLIETYNGAIKESEGTGFVYKIDNKSAYILTNEHVIVGKDIKVTNEKKEITGELLGKDAYLDIAVIKIDKKYVNSKLEFSEQEEKIGEKVYIIGNPLGKKYINTITTGILSGKDRLVKTELKGKEILMEMLQTDATINHGSSGSPLLNDNQEVIGIITLKLIDVEIEGMGFAIPIERVKKYLENIEKNVEIEWPKLGVETINISNSAQLATNNIKVPNEIKDGVVILNVNENSNAEKSGLKKGDIIIEIDNNKISNYEYLSYEIMKHDIGDTINIKYIRDNKKYQVDVKLDSLK